MSDGDEPRPEKPQVDDLLERTDRQRQGENMCFVSPEAKAASQSKVAGETDFESRDLEVMQAMVDDANPSELETASTDLWTAAGKIKEIGEEIKKRVDKVGWKGEFGETFHGWGHRLGDDIIVLSEYTENAGKNIGAAGEGLSQVKTAMPKPDYTYAYAPRPETFPAPEKVETNPTYAAALKKEKDRGEAIQQMNRLASYYRVTRENMGSAPEPKFGTAPDMGFPVPPMMEAPNPPGGTTVADARSHTPSPGGGAVQSGVPGAPGSNAPAVSQDDVVHSSPVGTDLNSVAPPTVTPVDRGPAVVNTPVNNGPSHGPNLAGPGYPGPSNRSGYSKTQGSGYGQSKTPGPINGVPRSVSGPGGTSTGRSTGPTTPPAGRHTGIVGGTPQSSGSQSGTPRIPRGTVVGGEHGPMGRPPTGMGGGAGPTGAGTGSPSPGRRLASTPGGVVGNPRSAPLPGAAARPFTPGGTGLATNGSAGRPTGMAPRTGPATPGERSRNDSERPDYLTEDEETWAAGRAGHVPPVVE